MMKDPDPYTAQKKHPKMSAYSAFELELNKPRTKMIGLRVTESDMKNLKAIARRKGGTVTEVTYLLLLHKIIEIVSVPVPTNNTGRYKKAFVSSEIRWEVFERDDFRCKRCGSRRQLEVDHIHPESKGGKAVLKNLQTLCRKCNIKKGTKIWTTK